MAALTGTDDPYIDDAGTGALTGSTTGGRVQPVPYTFGGGADAAPGALIAATGGYDPMLYALAQSGGAGGGGDQKPSPYIQHLYDVSEQLTGGGQDAESPLTHFREAGEARDKAAAQKMDAIDRAMSLLQNTQGSQTVNLPLLAAAGGMLAPTRTGTFGESVGNTARAAVPAIAQQRQIERENALAQGQLGVEKAGVPMQLSEQQLQDYMAQLRLGEEYGQAAARGQAYEDMVKGRLTGQIINAGSKVDVANINKAARLGWADIIADRSRYKYIGPSQQDPSVGVYLDQRSGQQHFGPAATATGGKGGPSVSEWKYGAWLAVHPGDRQGALDFVAGHKQMGPEEAAKFAQAEAAKEMIGAKPEEIDKRAQEIMQNVLGAYGGKTGTAAPAAAPATGGSPKPASNEKPKSDKGAAATPAAPKQLDTGKAEPWMYQRPPGVPQEALISPSTKTWWWKDQNGKDVSAPAIIPGQQQQNSGAPQAPLVQ